MKTEEQLNKKMFLCLGQQLNKINAFSVDSCWWWCIPFNWNELFNNHV